MDEATTWTDRLDRVESVLDIQRLVAEYAHGTDKCDLDRFLAVWHPDAVWDVGTSRFTGLDEIRAAIEHQWLVQPQMHHWTANLSVDVPVAADRATGECDVDVVTRTADGRWWHSGGTYRDVYARRDGRWSILRRTAYVHFTRQTSAPDRAGGAVRPEARRVAGVRRDPWRDASPTLA